MSREDRILNWRRASAPEASTPGVPLNSLPSHAVPVHPGRGELQRTRRSGLTSDRGNGSARYSDCHFPACIRAVLLFLRLPLRPRVYFQLFFTIKYPIPGVCSAVCFCSHCDCTLHTRTIVPSMDKRSPGGT